MDRLSTNIFISEFLARTNIYVLTLLILLPFFSSGQKDIARGKGGIPLKSTGFFLMTYVKLETLPFYNKKSEISARFPFHSFDTTTNVRRNDTFNISPTNPLSLRPVLLNLSVELNKNKNCFSIQLMTAINYFSQGGYGGGVSVGYGRMLVFNRFKTNKITLKPFIYFTTFNINMPVGYIDNENKYLSIFGDNYNPSYTVTHYSSSTKSYSAPTSTTSKATKLGVEYSLQSTILSPQIIVSNNRMQRIYWSFNLGWLINLYSSGGLNLRQYPNGKSNLISFNNSELNISENGTRIHKFPYKITGCVIGFSIGVYLNK